jgi:hypothetical protein
VTRPTPKPPIQSPDKLLGEMSSGLFALLRFLRHEFERELEHADLRLEGVDELDLEGRELALEIGHALLEGLEFNRGYILEAFAALGELRPECRRLPTPGGERTVAVLTLSPAEHARQALGLTNGEKVVFDGVFAYLEDAHADCRLWAEIGDQAILADESAARGKLPLVR